MLLLASHIKQLPIVSMETGRQVAVIIDFLINHSNLGLLAFICHDRKNRRLILMGHDIRFIARDCILINDFETLSEADDIARLPTMVANQFNPLDKQVSTQNGQKLGRVIDYAINLDTSYIQKLYARPTFFQSRFHDQIIIDRSQIIELTDKTIIVQDSTELVSSAANVNAARMSS